MSERRQRKQRIVTALGRFLVNPLIRALHRLGIPAPGTAILETTGRRSGEPRRIPVGDGLVGDEFWIVVEHGLRSAYVKNLQANPRVRIRTARRWRTGTAAVVDGDDPRERIRWLAERRGRAAGANGALVRALGTDLAVVRIDLDPA